MPLVMGGLAGVQAPAEMVLTASNLVELVVHKVRVPEELVLTVAEPVMVRLVRLSIPPQSAATPRQVRGLRSGLSCTWRRCRARPLAPVAARRMGWEVSVAETRLPE